MAQKQFKITNKSTGETFTISSDKTPTQEDINKVKNLREKTKLQGDIARKQENERPWTARIADQIYRPSEAMAPSVMAPEDVKKLPTSERLGRLGKEVVSGLLDPSNIPGLVAPFTGPVGLTAAGIAYAPQMIQGLYESGKATIEDPSLENVVRSGVAGLGVAGAGAGIKYGMKGYGTPKVQAPKPTSPRAPINKQLSDSNVIDAEFVGPHQMPSSPLPKVKLLDASKQSLITDRSGPQKLIGEKPQGPIVAPPSSLAEQKLLTAPEKGAIKMGPSSLGEQRLLGSKGEVKVQSPIEQSPIEQSIKPGEETFLLETPVKTPPVESVIEQTSTLPEDVKYIGEQKVPDGESIDMYNLILPDGGKATFTLKKGADLEAKAESVRQRFGSQPSEPKVELPIENTWIRESESSLLQQMRDGASGQIRAEIDTVLGERGLLGDNKIKKETLPSEKKKQINNNDLIHLAAKGDEAAINLLDMIDEKTLNKADSKRITELYNASQIEGNKKIPNERLSEEGKVIEVKPPSETSKIKKVISEEIIPDEPTILDEATFTKYNEQLEANISLEHIESNTLREIAKLGKEAGLDIETVVQDIIDNTPRMANNVNRAWAAANREFRSGEAGFFTIDSMFKRVAKKADPETGEILRKARDEVSYLEANWTKPERVIGRMGTSGKKLEEMIERAQFESDSLKGRIELTAHEAFKGLTSKEAGQRIAVLKNGSEVPLNSLNMDKYVNWDNGVYRPKEGVQKIVRMKGSLSNVILDNAPPANPKIAQAAELFKQAMNDLGDEAEMSGVSTITAGGKQIPFTKMGYEYWPRAYTEGFFESLKKNPKDWNQIIKNVASEKKITLDEAETLLKNRKLYAELTTRGQHQRVLKQDVSIIDPEVVYQHIEQMSHRVGMTKALGPDDIRGSLVNDELVKLQNEGWDRKFASETIAKLVGREGQKDKAAPGEFTVYKAITDINNMRLMTSFVINNIAGATPMVARVGEANVLRGLGATLSNFEVSKRLANLSGARLGGVVDRGGSYNIPGTSIKINPGKMLGIPMSERFIRTWADQAGRANLTTLIDHINKLHPSSPEFLRAKKLLDNAIGSDSTSLISRGKASPEELSRAGWQLAKDTQGLINPATFPDKWQQAANNSMMNLAMQYKRMASQSMGSLIESIKLNPARALKAITITGPIIGEVVGDVGSALFGALAGTITGEGAIKAAITDVNRRGESLSEIIGSIKTADNVKLQDRLGFSDSQMKMLGRYIENMNRGFALGLIGDLIYSAAYWGGQAGGEIVSGGISPIFEFGFDMMKSIMKGGEDMIYNFIPQRIGSSIKRSENRMVGPSPIVRPPSLPSLP